MDCCPDRTKGNGQKQEPHSGSSMEDEGSKHHQLLTTHYVRALMKGKFYFNNSMGIEETDSLGTVMVMQYVVGKPALLPEARLMPS